MHNIMKFKLIKPLLRSNDINCGFTMILADATLEVLNSTKFLGVHSIKGRHGTLPLKAFALNCLQAFML